MLEEKSERIKIKEKRGKIEPETKIGIGFPF